MKIIGLTGGIGSGKTTMSEIFMKLGVPVYNADDEAKALMNRSKVIKRKLKTLFGESAYKHEQLNKAFIKSKIFSDDSLRLQMNSIVHPKVKAHFQRWIKKQKSPYVIKEAAIIFEIGQEKAYDKIIVVTADRDQRIQRVQKRDNSSKQDVENVISKQWPEQEKLKHADYVIINNDINVAKNQALKIHKKLLKYSKDS